MRIKLALISAFFMSFFSYSIIDMSDLRGAKGETKHCYKHEGNNKCGKCIEFVNPMAKAKESFDRQYSPVAGAELKNYRLENNGSYGCGKPRVTVKADIFYWGTYGGSASKNFTVEQSQSCPPNGSPDHIHPVHMPTDSNPTNIMCAKEKVNDDDCPTLGDIPNLSFGSSSGVQSICFNNPNNPQSPNVCAYESDENGMFNLPDFGSQEPVSCGQDGNGDDTGADKPPPPDLDEDGCFTAENGKYCAKDPDDVCEIETGIEGHTAYNCQEGCGKVTIADGSTGFYCTEEGDDDGLPSLDCSDTEYAETNPDICAVDNNTDKDGDGQTDSKDMVQGLNELKQQQKEGNLKLNEISDGVKGLDKKQGEANKLLADLKGNTKASNQLLSTIAENTFSTQDQLKKINAPLEKGEKGNFDIEAAAKELELAETEYQTKFNSIKNEAANIIEKLNAGGGSFDSCHDLISMNGVVHNRCTSQFSDEMKVISNGVLLLFTILAGFIVLRGATKND